MSFALCGQEVRSWTGMLVASGCRTGDSSDATVSGVTARAPREKNSTYEAAQNQAASPPARSSSADSGQMARTTDRGSSVVDAASDPLARTTTPPIDDKGTRGKADTATPNRVYRKDGGPDRKPDANHLDASCRIGQHTSAFALLLDDGKLVRFDEAGNSTIVQQLQSQDRVAHKTKIFRAKVKGGLQNDLLSVDSLEF